MEEFRGKSQEELKSALIELMEEQEFLKDELDDTAMKEEFDENQKKIEYINANLPMQTNEEEEAEKIERYAYDSDAGNPDYHQESELPDTDLDDESRVEDFVLPKMSDNLFFAEGGETAQISSYGDLKEELNKLDQSQLKYQVGVQNEKTKEYNPIEKIADLDKGPTLEYAKGGETFKYDPNIDYFSEYDLLPKDISDDIMQEGELDDYNQTKKLLNKLESKGWTFDYGLGNDAFDLRPIMKSKKYGSEYKKDEDIILYRPMDSNEDWSEVSDEAFNEEERKDFDKEMEKLFKEKAIYSKGGALSKEFKFDKNFVIYVPSTSDVGNKISKKELDKRVDEVEKYVANEFGGYTETDTDGGYKSTSGEIIEEDIVKVSVFANNKDWKKNESKVVSKVKQWAKRWGQEAIGFEYEGDLYYIDEGGKFAKGGYLEGKTYYIVNYYSSVSDIPKGIPLKNKSFDTKEVANTFLKSIENKGGRGFITDFRKPTQDEISKLDRDRNENYMMAKGGEVTYTDTDNYANRRMGNGGVKIWENYKNINNQKAVGSFSHTYNKRNTGDYYLFLLDDYDRKFYSHIALKPNEMLFRNETETGRISKSLPLIKINIENGRVYFMSDGNDLNSDIDDKNPKFSKASADVNYLSLDDRIKKYNQGLITYDELIESVDKTYAKGGNLMSSGIETRELADSFTFEELNKLLKDKKISKADYNGAKGYLQSWIDIHPTYLPQRDLNSPKRQKIRDRYAKGGKTGGGFKVGDNVIVRINNGKRYKGKIEKLGYSDDPIPLPLKIRTGPTDTIVFGTRSGNIDVVSDDGYAKGGSTYAEGGEIKNHSDIVKLIESSDTYMTLYDEDEKDLIMYSTRENGNVGEELASDKDIDEAIRLKRIVESKFNNVVVEVEEVDEWVHLNIRPIQKATYRYKFHKHSTPSVTSSGFTETYDTMNEMIEKRGSFVDGVNWEKVKKELENIIEYPNNKFTGWYDSEPILISKPSDNGNDWGYFFSVSKSENKNEYSKGGYTYAEGGEINLPNGVFIDTRKTTQSKDEILEMYSNQGYTAIGGGSLLSDNFKKYNRDIDIYIVVGEIKHTSNNTMKGRIYMKKNEVAVQNFISKNIDAKVITKIHNTDSGSTYAEGGETASPITNYHKNYMGTLSFDLKVKGMRKPQDFIVYPITGKTNIIRIQSDKKWGEIDASTGRGILSKSGNTSWSFVLDVSDRNVNKFELSKEELEELKSKIRETSGKEVGNVIITTDNSGAELLEHGGKLDMSYIEIYQYDDDGNYTVIIDRDVYDMNTQNMPNTSMDMFVGNRNEFPSDISHFGKKIKFEDAPIVIKDKIEMKKEEFKKGGEVSSEKDEDIKMIEQMISEEKDDYIKKEMKKELDKLKKK